MKPKSIPSALFDRHSSAAAEALSAQTGGYQRHVDILESSGDQGGRAAEVDGHRPAERCRKEIHFAFLPERYQPLEDDEARAEAKAEKKKRKKEQYKKVRKNVGKALRATWKCLMLGLYNFALGYSTPITVATTFVPDFHPRRNTT